MTAFDHLRSARILSIMAGVPAKVVFEGDQQHSLHPALSSDQLPLYQGQASVNSIPATTFDVLEGATRLKVATFSVYTPKSPDDALTNPPVSLVAGNTQVLVKETLLADLPLVVGDELIGTNFSTFVIGPGIVVKPTTVVETAGLELTGHQTIGWGELLLKNELRQASSFSGTWPPEDALVGQLWFDSTLEQLNIKLASGWQPMQAQSPASGAALRFEQPTAATTWVWEHNLNLPPPSVGILQVFVDLGSGNYKAITPSDATFSPNSITIEFSAARAGVALLKI